VLEIVSARSNDDIASARELFLEYSASLGIDLCFQNFDNELRELPGEYAPPQGRLLLARVDGELAGCAALRRIDEASCEMKRLYVPPRARGKGVGRALTTAVIDAARQIGYRRMRLDTLPSMREAIPLYESLGFRRIAPYYRNPIEGAVFMELELGAAPVAPRSATR
jgi:putative acetyltransferase